MARHRGFRNKAICLPYMCVASHQGKFFYLGDRARSIRFTWVLQLCVIVMSCTLLLVWALWVPDAAGSGRHKASGHYAGKALPVVIEEAPRSVQKGRNDVEYKDPQFHCCSSSPRPGATEVEEVEYSASWPAVSEVDRQWRIDCWCYHAPFC